MKKTTVRIFTEQAVIERIQSRAGIRYQSAQLATYFGVPTARMTEVLVKLVALNQVRRVRCGGSPTMYYLPSEAEKQAEARLAAKAAEPLRLVEVESEREQVRRELGFGLINVRVKG